MLVGNGVPYRTRHRPGVQEMGRWKDHIADIAAEARTGLNVREALDIVRHPGWTWHGAAQPAASPPTDRAMLAGAFA